MPSVADSQPSEIEREIERYAEAWLKIDPDPETREQLEGVLKAPEDRADKLSELFSSRLSFGTAGLRAELGTGPARMNRVLVQMVTRALFQAVTDSSPAEKPLKIPLKIVVGYDARKNSDIFARDAAAVIEECGGKALLIDEPLPTPVLAYSVLKQSAAAGIMVTASHNPRADNGYKVYLKDGAQIAPPFDKIVEQNLAKIIQDFLATPMEDLSDFPVKDHQFPALNIQNITEPALDDYVSSLAGELKPEVSIPADLRVVYTPVHGVGKKVIEVLFQEMGFPAPLVVPEQGEPDGTFPTAAYPNPEEPGVMDLAIQLAQENDASLVLANDPDADRLAAAVLDSKGGWRNLTGDEIGVLLADYCMRRAPKKQAPKKIAGKSLLVATTCVSSQLLGKMAKARGIHYEETLTGFKWIARADLVKDEYSNTEFIFGYEEALGYSVLPQIVRDKDGISAAVAFVNLYIELAAENKTPLDRLNELSEEFGMHLTSAASIRYEGTGAEKSAIAMARLRAELPSEIGGVKVSKVLDYSEGKTLRPANVLSFYLENESRIVIRPSGTEPKLKVYVELVERDTSKKAEAEAALKALTDSAAQLIAAG